MPNGNLANNGKEILPLGKQAFVERRAAAFLKMTTGEAKKYTEMRVQILNFELLYFCFRYLE